MGVTGLWTVVQPCARPIKVETLNKKRLAVDASIWIYQFLKAVRDKEGNALRNSHVVGFFRRICKLLFIGIKPVFVFDGGAPALKRQTITGRKQRREGRREDAVRTAGKLLALQMQRRAEDEERKRKDDAQAPPQAEEEQLPENLVYVEELQMTAQERQQNRKFKKKDAYHLPELDVSLAEMSGPNDPRIMSLEELETYARQFDTGEDINVYDFSKIDFDSPFFLSLPDSDRYNILNAARLRSRLRMGYSKDQLDTMFPDRMAFSRFQIERVRERNELTQRLMNINGMNSDSLDNRGRVAGEKGREYVLVKNEGVEGGWALGVVSKEGERNEPIDVDKATQQDGRVQEQDDEDEWEEDEFEDIPVPGLNRLPSQPEGQKQPYGQPSASSGNVVEHRKSFYKSRGKRPSGRPMGMAPSDDEETESLFLSGGFIGPHERTDAGSHPPTGSGEPMDDDDSDTQRAIALSLEQDEAASGGDQDDDYMDVFPQSKVEESKPFSRGSGKSIAHLANSRSNKVTQRVSRLADSDDDDDGMDLQAALAESRRAKAPALVRAERPPRVEQSSVKEPKPITKAEPAKAPGFSGPLPFEKLDLGSSLLGKKKMEKLELDNAGGFEKNSKKNIEGSAPLPPWFSGDLRKGITAQEDLEAQDRRKDKLANEAQLQFQQPPSIRDLSATQVIDVEKLPEKPTSQVIDVMSSSEDEEEEDMVDVMDTQVAEKSAPEKLVSPTHDITGDLPVEHPDVAPRHGSDDDVAGSANGETDREPWKLNPQLQAQPQAKIDDESTKQRAADPVPSSSNTEPARSPTPEFEDVLSTSGPSLAHDVASESGAAYGEAEEQITSREIVEENDADRRDDDAYSDSGDEELFQQLAIEAQEHARFASTLNSKTAEQNAADFERELKALRSQQKKDRRDADEVTQTMITECQQLLTLFGLPYITAPMEAEAQCAELVSLGLVDGVVTDDSDIFLFGGTRIYKNIFNQAKFVECYLLQELTSELGLDRQKMISIAHLLGSDYTEGLTGVGPVTALELLSEFGSLQAFKEWYTAVQTGARPKAEDAGAPFRRKFRRNATKLFLPPTFPDLRVDEAYLHPVVDSDPQPFVWGVPDLAALRHFLSSTIGWSEERTDEILVPVIRDMNRRETEGTQSNITNFFGGGVGAGAFAPRRREEGKSKRMEMALSRMAERARIETAGEIEDASIAERPTSEAGAIGKEKAAEKSFTAASRTQKGRKKRSKPTTPSSESPSDFEQQTEQPKKSRKSRKNGASKKAKSSHED